MEKVKARPAGLLAAGAKFTTTGEPVAPVGNAWQALLATGAPVGGGGGGGGGSGAGLESLPPPQPATRRARTTATAGAATRDFMSSGYAVTKVEVSGERGLRFVDGRRGPAPRHRWEPSLAAAQGRPVGIVTWRARSCPAAGPAEGIDTTGCVAARRRVRICNSQAARQSRGDSPGSVLARLRFTVSRFRRTSAAISSGAFR